MIKSCIVSAAEKTVSCGGRRQPVWFEENFDELMDLINEKNKTNSQMLSNHTVAARRTFRQQQRVVKRVVKRG